MVVALGFISGRLGIHVDFNAYITNPSAWMSVWMLFSVISIIAFRAMGVMQHTLLVLLKEIERQRDEIHHLANHDHLTGLPTMRLAQDRLEMAVHHAERNQEKVALLFIDLDGFKKVNDQLGHDCGDYALQEVAQRMVKIVRPDDTVARRSGDEFLIILEGVTDPNYSTSIARAIITTIKQPMTYQGQSFTLGASVGISIFPDHTRNLDHLKYLADQAMYTVKHHQKNDFSVSQVWSDLPLKPS